MLQAVVFDLDDTLIDWSGRELDWAEVGARNLGPLHQHLREQGHTIPDLKDLVGYWGTHIRAAWESVSGPEWAAPRHDRVLGQTLQSAGLNPAAFDMQNLLRHFAWNAVPGVRPFEDTVPVLQTLRSSGLKIGLLTNASQPMWMRDRELESLGLLPYFDARITAGDVGKVKPHPAPFLAILRALGTPPEDAVYVGDRAVDDVTGAQAAGMRAVWVRHGMAELPAPTIKPNAIIGALGELLDVLYGWYPGLRERAS